MDVSREKIELPETMMRETVGEKSLEDLVKSIKELGIIHPLTVRKKGEKYELIAGLRRLMAADVLKLEKILVRVVRAGDEKAEKIKMDENREREDISPIEEGVFLVGMMEKFNWKQKQLAEKFGVSESYISQRISTVDWPDFLKEVVVNGQINFSVAREFAGIRDMDEMRRVIEQGIRGGVSPAVAARWKHEINRDIVQAEMMGVDGSGGPGGPGMPEILYHCNICGERAEEAEQQMQRVCDGCAGVIKAGQEQGVFRKDVVEEGATGGEQVKQEGG